MKKIHILGITLCALFSLSVVVASSAFGDPTHLWLVNGSSITGANFQPSDTEGEILLEETKFGTKILCSGLFVGLLLSEGKDTIEKIEDLVGNIVEGNSNTLSITCNWDTETGSTGPCEGASLGGLILVFPVNLPWKTELELVGTVWDDLIENSGAGAPGYLVECTVFGIKTDTSCTGNSGGLVENETGGVLGEFRPTEETISAPASCSGPLGSGVGLVFSDAAGLTTSTGGTVSVSES